MRKLLLGLLGVVFLYSCLAQPAKADVINVSGGTLTGDTVLFINALGFPQVSTNAPWLITSSLGGVWSNQTAAALAPAFQDFGSYMTLALTTPLSPFPGTGPQFQVVFALSGTVSQFAALLTALPFGNTIQLPLLTTGSGCEAIPGTCTGENIFQFVNNTLAGQSIDTLTGRGFLTITNDPGLYDVTITSTPLQTTATPEPSSLILLGSGLLGLMGMAMYKRRFA